MLAEREQEGLHWCMSIYMFVGDTGKRRSRQEGRHAPLHAKRSLRNIASQVLSNPRSRSTSQPRPTSARKPNRLGLSQDSSGVWVRAMRI